MSSSGQPNIASSAPVSESRPENSPSLYVISGPSGSGKSTITARLADAGQAAFSVSYTTRPRHPSEREGVDYRFVSVQQFEQLRAEGELLESAQVHGNWYGTSRRDIDDFLARKENVMLEIDINGAAQVRACGLPHASVFILPPSPEELLARLSGRQREESDQIRQRLATARKEVMAITDFDFFVVNENLDRALQAFSGIMNSRDENYKTGRQQEQIAKWQEWARNEK